MATALPVPPTRYVSLATIVTPVNVSAVPIMPSWQLQGSASTVILTVSAVWALITASYALVAIGSMVQSATQQEPAPDTA